MPLYACGRDDPPPNPSAISIVVSVTDSGIGIAEEDLPRIFERFYRARRPELRNGSRGTGLGLFLARWIAEQHRATITVQSAVGAGSIFRVNFPTFRGSREFK